MGRRCGFFDLEEQRVLIVVAHHKHQISSGSYAAYPNDTMPHIYDVITAKQEAPLRGQRVCISFKPFQDCVACLLINRSENRRISLKVPAASYIARRHFTQ